MLPQRNRQRRASWPALAAGWHGRSRSVPRRRTTAAPAARERRSQGAGERRLRAGPAARLELGPASACDSFGTGLGIGHEFVEPATWILRRVPREYMRAPRRRHLVVALTTCVWSQVLPGSKSISATKPGPGWMVSRKPCNLTIATTRLRPRPKPFVCRLLSER
jgi:hypothetical protein